MSGDLKRIHKTALEEFDAIYSALRDERRQCLEDRRFYSIAGAQYEGALASQFEYKPQYEVNKIHLSIMRIFSEYRNNRITVNFTSKEGNDSEKLANTCSSLYRADEQNSVAEEAYDNAFEEAVGGGFGAWRLRACYVDEEDEDDDRQHIKIEPITDADVSVFFDLNAKRQDKSDADHCFVISAYSKDQYEREFKGEAVNSFDKVINSGSFDWSGKDFIYIAEYYKHEFIKDIVYIYESIDGDIKKVRQSEIDADEDLLELLSATGWLLKKKKKITKKVVHKYIIDGLKVLDDCGILAGKNIPIVPMFGKRWFIDGIERCMGHVRLAKDVQRLKNMQLSKLAEISAYSAVEKPIFYPAQIKAHQLMWEQDNVKNYPYLLIEPMHDLNGNIVTGGPVGQLTPPAIPDAMAALLQITEQDMRDILGNQQAGEQIQSNISGKAVELIQGRLDMQSFIYLSNLSKAIKRSGEIWLSMAKELLTEPGRKVKGIGVDNKSSQIEIMRPIVNPVTNKIERENDLSSADFDVCVDVGPSSASKKQTTVRNLTGMLQITQDPETAQVLGSLIMMNMEGEGLGDGAAFFRKKLVGMGVLKPTDEELKELQAAAQNQPPDANTQFLQASAEEAQAKAAKARADTVLVIAKSEETRAKTAQTMANLDTVQNDNIIKNINALRDLESSQPELNNGETPLNLIRDINNQAPAG